MFFIFVGHERIYAIKLSFLRDTQESQALDNLEARNMDDSEMQFVIRFKKGAKVSALG